MFSLEDLVAAQVIRIKCPNLACQRILAVPPHARGKLVRCRSCGATLSIPQQKIQTESTDSSQASDGSTDEQSAA